MQLPDSHVPPIRTPNKTAGQKVNVVFVCTGNTCRSPYAEFVARSLETPVSGMQISTAQTATTHHDFSSAGTHVSVDLGFDPNMAAEFAARHPGPGRVTPNSCAPSPPVTTQPAPTWAASFSSRQLTEHIARTADILIALTHEHANWITDTFEFASIKTVPLRPYARACATDIASGWDPDAVARLSTGYHPELWTNTFRDDVPDPYRLGRSEAARTADILEELLGTIANSQSTE